MESLLEDFPADRLLWALRQMRTHQIRTDSGICWNLAELIENDLSKELKAFSQRAIVDMVGELALDWPHYSGNQEYPVPHPLLGAQEAYLLDDMWDEETAYGASRRDLLEHLITKVERAVSHGSS